ncbi:MAG TPA: transposase [Pseudonocardia sp.]|nr:transposase [Pseudonocardia sp.]
MSEERRLVGVDLGIASDHTVRVLRGDGSEVARRRALPTVESLTAVEAAALTGAPAGTRLEVVMEPTGPAWLPVAVFFTARGHRVFRVSSAKAADLRRFLSRHAKSNGIDADTLARLPLLAPGSLQPLELPDCPQAAALDRRVRACDRLTAQGALHQRRIKDLVRQLLPNTPLTGDLSRTDLAVLERWADPRALLTAGRARLLAVIAKTSRGQQGPARADRWRAAAAAALELYGDHPAIAFTDLAAEVLTEVRLLQAVRTELAGHAAARAEAYRFTDPAALAASLPGLAEVGAPTVTAIIGRAGRFRTGKQFRSFTGLAPRASETGNTDRKGQPMSKAGNRLLRTTLIRAADNARRQDPQLARIYYVQMVERGAEHLKACCVVAAHLAERLHTVLVRGMPYVICDTDGEPVDPAAAKKIIAEQWTVPAEVRARRRSHKPTSRAGKAPQQVLNGHDRSDTRRVDKRGDLPRGTSVLAPRTPVKATT